ncbi:hypothetical protein GIB67_019308 [Kingdonia uniflora]|uniref:Reticulon-like protein n=1 Tax=Kingdonia uniflora TaxID=39325 RepID=A0A7J7L1C2_9MAGN|nr:hypothetical protein GIB67_019308 [Kingdonia uniflora]
MENDLLNTSSPILPISVHQSLGGGADLFLLARIWKFRMILLGRRRRSEVAQVWVNRVLGVAHDIALGGDYKLFFKVAFSLWLVSFVGNVFNFLTFVYMGEFCVEIITGVLFSLSIPVLCNKYQDTVDDKLSLTHRVLSKQYRKLDEKFLSKIPKPSKKKKTQ